MKITLPILLALEADCPMVICPPASTKALAAARCQGFPQSQITLWAITNGLEINVPGTVLWSEEKLQLNRDRQKAVREAGAREKSLCSQGRGTVDWTPAQQAALMRSGWAAGYEGQHMKAVAAFPQYAGDPNNILFLSHEDHLAAHNSGQEQSGYRSAPNGYYDPTPQTMHGFGDDPPYVVSFDLSEPCFLLAESTEETFSASQDEALTHESLPTPEWTPEPA
jgi:hypothetical protein